MNVSTKTTAGSVRTGDIVIQRYTTQDAGTLGSIRAGRKMDVVDEMEVRKIVGMGSSLDRRGLRSTWKRTDQPAPFIAIYFKDFRSWIVPADFAVEVAR
jgi:hypothetical protein